MSISRIRLAFATAPMLMLAAEVAAEIPRGFFTDVTPVLASDYNDFHAVVSGDGLTMVFANSQLPRADRGGNGQQDLWMTTRTTKAEAFGNITNLGPVVNSSADEDLGSLSADGQTLYFGSNRSDGNWEIYRATRTGDTFGNVERLGTGVNTDIIENGASISSDALTLYFYRTVVDGPSEQRRLWNAPRPTTDAAFGNALDLGDELNGPEGNSVDLWFPSISADETVVFFSDWTREPQRAGGEGFSDIWVSTRPTKDDPFGSPVNLNERWQGTNINTDMLEGAAYISPDWPAAGSNLYFASNRLNPQVADIFQATWVSLNGLQAGDADQDLKFDQLDLVQVQVAAKYLNGRAATWGEGDWNGAPGGSPGNPPAGDGLFDQLDIIAAQQAALYLTGRYAVIRPSGQSGDAKTSVVYDAGTGELSVDAPAGVELTSINIDSAGRIFAGEAAQNLGGSFDNDADGNIFKATFGGSFGSISFGSVAQSGLSEEFVLGDLTVIGSLTGGGDLGEVDLIYVPEPASALLLAVAFLIGLFRIRQVHERGIEASRTFRF